MNTNSWKRYWAKLHPYKKGSILPKIKASLAKNHDSWGDKEWNLIVFPAKIKKKRNLIFLNFVSLMYCFPKKEKEKKNEAQKDGAAST